MVLLQASGQSCNLCLWHSKEGKAYIHRQELEHAHALTKAVMDQDLAATDEAYMVQFRRSISWSPFSAA